MASRRRRNIVISSIVGIVVLSVAGVAVYLDQIAPLQTTVITVNNASIRMRTLLNRTNLSGQDAVSMLQTLTNEEIMRQVLPYPPYNIQVTDEDIDEFLRASAQADGEPLSDSDYRAWYRDQLNESRLSRDDFRDLAESWILTERLGVYLAERTPTIAEQVRLSMIVVQGLDALQATESRLKAGEDFAVVAREVNVDPQLREDGGDLGWQARNSLTPLISQVVFDVLKVNEISEPLKLQEDLFALLLVTERAAARELSEVTRAREQSAAAENWIREERGRHDIKFHGFKGPYDSTTDAWIQWQLQRMNR
jgi:parvulin-like peptidyl-prolyl isomerase